jgi:hypothetical protein
LYISGRYVHYERVGNKLYLDGKYFGKIFILYKGTILDEDGLPEITEEEANAIAAFCAYYSKFKEAIKTNNKAALEMSTILQNKWRVLCS